jgi:DNA replication protein DnaD
LSALSPSDNSIAVNNNNNNNNNNVTHVLLHKFVANVSYLLIKLYPQQLNKWCQQSSFIRTQASPFNQTM